MALEFDTPTAMWVTPGFGKASALCVNMYLRIDEKSQILTDGIVINL
jgi:hypothetical protein